jgi:hypothetical protein
MRIRVAAVAEPRPPWAREIEILFASLTTLDADLQRVAYFVGEPAAETRGRLARLGVDVRVSSPVHPAVPQANKLRMLDEPDRYDVLFALDTDVLVTGDFTKYAGDSFRAKPADADPIEEWPEIFDAAGVPFPAERVVTTTEPKETVPYFNSGVLVIPAPLVEPLRDRWLARLQMPMDWPSVRNRPWTRDQIALTLALADVGVVCDPLPVAANFPTTVPTRVGDPDEIRPELVHHHHRVSRLGEVLRVGYAQPDAAIAAANAVVSRALGRRLPPLPYRLRVAPDVLGPKLGLRRVRQVPARARGVAGRLRGHARPD